MLHEVLPLSFVARHFTSALLEGGAPIPLGHYEEESMRQTVVPFRNGIMLAVAAGFAESVGAGGLVIAAHAGITPFIQIVEKNLWLRWRLQFDLEPTPNLIFCAPLSTWIKRRFFPEASRSAWITRARGRVTLAARCTAENAVLAWNAVRRLYWLGSRIPLFTRA